MVPSEHRAQRGEEITPFRALFFLRALRESATHNFLLEICAALSRAVALRLSIHPPNFVSCGR